VIRWLIAGVVLVPVLLFVFGAARASKSADISALRIASDHDRQVAELSCYIEARERAGLDAWARATGQPVGGPS
jgi:hypothetical protein